MICQARLQTAPNQNESGVFRVLPVLWTHSIATLFVLPTGEALAAAWAGDNTGPPALADVQGFYKTLRTHYPAAEIAASTFDAFFAAANAPAVKARLPVVTAGKKE